MYKSIDTEGKLYVKVRVCVCVILKGGTEGGISAVKVDGDTCEIPNDDRIGGCTVIPFFLNRRLC